MKVLDYAKSLRMRELETLNNKIQELSESLTAKQTEINEMNGKKFNIFQRKAKAEHLKNKEILSKSIADAYAELSVLEGKVEEFNQKKLPIIEKATTLRELGLTYQQLTTVMKEEGVDAKFESCEECLNVTGSEFSNNKDVMMRAVAENASLIEHDQTNDKDVYIAFIDQVTSKMDLNDIGQRVYYNMIQSVRDRIINESSVESTEKYTVPNERIFEAIRGYIKEGRENGAQDMGMKVMLNTYKDIEMIDGKIDRADVEKLEGMYTPDSKNYYVHASAFATTEQIFKTGLRASAQPPPERKIERTAYETTSFLSMLGYTYQHTGEIMQNNFLVAIPKNEKNVWGANDRNAKILDNYLLPQYVIGTIDTSDVNNMKFIENNEKDRMVYKYLYVDNAPMDSEPNKIMAHNNNQEI